MQKQPQTAAGEPSSMGDHKNPGDFPSTEIASELHTLSSTFLQFLGQMIFLYSKDIKKRISFTIRGTWNTRECADEVTMKRREWYQYQCNVFLVRHCVSCARVCLVVCSLITDPCRVTAIFFGVGITDWPHPSMTDSAVHCSLSMEFSPRCFFSFDYIV